MNKNYKDKSSLEEITRRFDHDVERFSNLETAQGSTIDAPLVMELMTKAAASATPSIRRVLDIGCGAGNNTLKLLEHAPKFDADLVDLSAPMLERAKERVGSVTPGRVSVFQGDFRTVDLVPGSYDVILAAVLHHLRDESDWEKTFQKIFDLTAPGGSVWVSDLIWHDSTAVQDLMYGRYGDYLESVGGEEYRDNVFAYIEKEDSPRSVFYQMELLKKVGFETVELLHKNSCFAAFGAIKGGP